MIFSSKHAACRDEDRETFFPVRESKPTEHPNPAELRALAICNRCPVLAACQREALSNARYHEYGVIGGLTAGQRRVMLREVRAA